MPFTELVPQAVEGSFNQGGRETVRHLYGKLRANVGQKVSAIRSYEVLDGPIEDVQEPEILAGFGPLSTSFEVVPETVRSELRNQLLEHHFKERCNLLGLFFFLGLEQKVQDWH